MVLVFVVGVLVGVVATVTFGVKLALRTAQENNQAKREMYNMLAAARARKGKGGQFAAAMRDANQGKVASRTCASCGYTWIETSEQTACPACGADI